MKKRGIIFHEGFLQQKHLYATALLQVHYGEDNIDIMPTRRKDFSRTMLKGEYFLFDPRFSDQDCRDFAPCAYASLSQLWRYLGPKKFSEEQVMARDKYAQKIDQETELMEFNLDAKKTLDDIWNDQLTFAYEMAWSVIREMYAELENQNYC